MSFWTPKRTIRLIFWILQIFLILILSWVISTDLLWSAEIENVTDPDSVLIEESENAYSVAEETKDYIISSMDNMITHLVVLQSKLESFTWLSGEEANEFKEKIDNKIENLSINKASFVDKNDVEDMRTTFSEIYDDWIGFRSELNLSSRDLFAGAIVNYCRDISTVNEAFIDTDVEFKKYLDFYATCENWKYDDVDLSSSMLDWIKVVE